MKKYFEYEGFPCIVHDTGVIESVDFTNDEWRIAAYSKKGQVLKPDVSSEYRRVTLAYQAKTKRVSVHRLVALAFIPNPDNKPFVNHIDSNPSNNDVSNLEWVTNAENMIHALHAGRLEVPMKILREANEGRKKPVIYKGEYYESLGAASRVWGVSRKVISRWGTLIDRDTGGMMF